ncbi:MAG TPA: hypothetical protein PKC79_06165 [Solidesulfovibrio magneticus]|nr:hypothetical protein [Solidesulfovibrio magneticus]
MSKEMQRTIDSLRESLAFNGFLVSLLTMKTFYPQTWYKSYDPKLLLEALDYHIARLSESSNIIATPVGLGAMAIIYQERVDGQAWPNYGEILTALKNDIVTNWDGIPVKRRTLDDLNREEDEAEGIFEQPSKTQ